MARNRGKGKKKKSGGKLGEAVAELPKNEVGASTVATLLSGKLSPTQKGADSSCRKRIAAAITTTELVPDCNQCGVGGGDSPPAVVLFRGDSFEAADYASQWLDRTQTAAVSKSAASSYRGTYEGDSGAQARVKPCVLDFASDSNPGGGWRGNQTGTQEEALCRMSSLGLALESTASTFSIPTSGAIYVHDVAVVRTTDGGWRDPDPSAGDRSAGACSGDDEASRAASMETAAARRAPPTLWCSVVAAALRNVDGNASVLERKTSGVVALAARKGHVALLAGAWGCGAFGNEVADVANAWKAAVGKPCGLTLVVFALPNKTMHAAFASAFQGRTNVARAAARDSNAT